MAPFRQKPWYPWLVVALLWVVALLAIPVLFAVILLLAFLKPETADKTYD